MAFRRLTAATVFGLGLASSVSASAQCRIHVVGPESALWLPAADQLDRELAARAWSDRCSAVVVVAADGWARLTFTSRDGRTAERQMGDPVELVPAVQALSIEGPSLSVAPPAEASSPRAPSSPPADRAPQPKPASEAGPYELNLLFGAQVGFRAGADHLISPCISAFGGVPVDRWELGILGRYEAHYVSTLGGNEGVPETSSIVFGVLAGRREPVGNVALRAGVTGLLAALREEDGNKDGQAEARLGAYGGAVWPAKGTLGVRADLALEVVPYSIGRSESNANGTSSLPWWGLTSMVGIEIR